MPFNNDREKVIDGYARYVDPVWQVRIPAGFHKAKLDDTQDFVSAVNALRVAFNRLDGASAAMPPFIYAQIKALEIQSTRLENVVTAWLGGKPRKETSWEA